MAEATETKYFDLADLDLMQEVQEIDPNAQLTDFPLPVPDTDEFPEGHPYRRGYLVIPAILIEENGKPGKLDKNGNPMFAVEWTIQDEGIPMPENLKQFKFIAGQKLKSWPSTRVNERTNTTEIDAILKAYTGKTGFGYSVGQKVAASYKLLTSGQPIRIATMWEAQQVTQNKEKPEWTRRRLKNFWNPELKMYQIVTEVPDGKAAGSEARTQAKIINYLPR